MSKYKFFIINWSTTWGIDWNKIRKSNPFCFKDFADLNTYTSVTYRAGITATFTVQVFILVTGILAIVEYKIGHFILSRT